MEATVYARTDIGTMVLCPVRTNLVRADYPDLFAILLQSGCGFVFSVLASQLLNKRVESVYGGRMVFAKNCRIVGDSLFVVFDCLVEFFSSDRTLASR